jgi:hypothetical protein
MCPVQSIAGPRSALRLGTYLLAAVGFILVGAGLAFLPAAVQRYLLLLLVVVVAAIWLIPATVRKEPSVTVQLLAFALAAKIVGSIARFAVLNWYGSGDALLYHAAGLDTFQMIRSLDFSFLRPPYFGTNFVEYVTGFLYAIIGPTLLGAFLAFSLASLAGMWFFYRAHRVAFPQGDHRIFFLLIFFVPTMAFWPSSLGKDALIVLGLGLATYGLARTLSRIAPAPVLQLLGGLAITFAVRPAVGAILLFATTVAFVLHPGRVGSPMTRPVTWILGAPLLIVGLVFAVQVASRLENVDVASGGTEYLAETSQTLEQGGSAYTPTLPTSPAGALAAAANVLFRPFPTEATTPQALLAGLESLGLMLLLIWRLPSVVRSVRLWRGGMIVGAYVMVVGMIVALSAFANFGLLARQRVQVLPYLFMIITAVASQRTRSRRRARREAHVPADVPAHVSAAGGNDRIRRMASATRRT